jgi:hypothetical protein
MTVCIFMSSIELLSLEQAQTDGLLTSAAANAEFSECESTPLRTSLSEAANALVGLETVISCGEYCSIRQLTFYFSYF